MNVDKYHIMRLYEIFTPRITYSIPNFKVEYEEALRYPEFQDMTLQQWVSMAKNGHKIDSTPEFIKNLNNTDANDPVSFNSLETDKQKRFLSAFNSNSMEMPIVILTNNGYELLGGNTRLTGLVAKGIYPPVWLIDVRKTNQKHEVNESYQQNKSWYHASPNKFDTFDVTKSDLGPHFGNLEQATHVINNRLGGNGILYKTKIKIYNPLKLTDVGSFHADNIADQLLKKKLISKQEYMKYTEKDAWKNRKQYNQEIRTLLMDKGFDGVTYQNNHEGKGTCVIPFNADDITIVDVKTI